MTPPVTDSAPRRLTSGEPHPSSFALINISMDSTKLDLSHMVPLALLALTLALLFLARRFLLQDPKHQNVTEPVPSASPSASHDEGLGQAASRHDIPDLQPDMVPKKVADDDA